MADEKNVNLFFVAKDIARTATCQVNDKATTATYYKLGEVVITNALAGLAATDTSLTKADEYITIKGRTADNVHISTPYIKGKYITSAFHKVYNAPVEQVVTLSGLTVPTVATKYLVKITTDHAEWGITMRSRTIMYSAAASASVLSIYAGIAAQINTNFDQTDGTNMPIVAVAAATYLTITALPLEPIVGRYTYDKFTFGVTLVDASIAHAIHTNLHVALVDGTAAGLTSGSGNTPVGTAVGVTTKGSGTGDEVREMEYQFRSNHLPYAQRMSSIYPVVFNIDAVSGACYDYLVLNYVDKDTFTENSQVNHFGTVQIAMEVGTNQSSNLKAALKDYLTDIGIAKINW